MPLEASRKRLVQQLHDASEKLEGLEAVVGDHPEDDPPALVGQLADAVIEAHGHVEDAVAAAVRLGSADGGTQLLEAERVDLPSIQHAMHRAIFGCLLNLAAPDNGAELARIARMRGGEWASWVRVIRPALAESVRVLEAAHGTVGECWCDVFERGGVWSAGVHQVVNICHRDASLAPANLEASLAKS